MDPERERTMPRARAVIVDDDAFTREQLAGELHRSPWPIDVVATAEDGREGVERIRSARPDLVFVDVQMPGLDGFAMLDALTERNFGVVFITSYDAYAIRAIRYSALDYLLKPIDPGELDAALERFARERSSVEGRIKHLLDRKEQVREVPGTLIIVTREGDRTIRTRDIVRCVSDGNYTWFHLTGDRRILSSYTLGNYADFLERNEFVRVHRSHMINRAHVRSVDPEIGIAMSDGSTIEFSRRRRAEVMAVLRGG